MWESIKQFKFFLSKSLINFVAMLGVNIVFLYVLTCMDESISKHLCLIGFPKTLISSNKFDPGKPNSKSKHILGLSLKAKV